MKRWLSVLALLAFVHGCDHDNYKIVMTPQGDEVRREITVWHTSQGGTFVTTQPATEPATAPATQPATQPASE